MPALRLIAVLALLLPGLALAGRYTPPGLYDASYSRLDNGLHVVLKPRDGARNVAFRVVAGVGDLDFPCGGQQTAHLLEHLLFKGTSRHTENELDALVEDHGGYWNAETREEETIYQLDIYSQHALLGLDVLYEIMSDSLISPDSVATARNIVHREMGGRPSALEHWLRAQGIGKNATTKAVEHLLPGSNYLCPGIETAEDISRDDLLEAFRRFYVPANMMLIAVGDFDAAELMQAIDRTFGRLPAGTAPASTRPTPPWPAQGERVTGTLAPVFGNEAHVGLAYRIPGYESDDYYALAVLRRYLDNRLFQEIRVERGLAYAPGAELYALHDFGFMLTSADVDLDATETAVGAIRDEIETLRAAPLAEETLERVKQRMLLQMVQGFESNMAIADYYADTWDELTGFGRLLDHESAIEKVTAADVYRVANRYLQPEQSVAFYEQPTLSHARLFTILAALLAILAWSGWRGWTKRRLRAGTGKRR